MQLPPTSVVISWPYPNYKNPITRGNELLVVTLVFFPIALFTVALRIFTRVKVSKSFGIDDVVLLLSIPPTAAIAVLTILAVEDWGWDRHIWDVRPKYITLGLKLAIVMECLFATAASLYKLSLLILTRRVMSVGTGILRHVATAGMLLVFFEGFVFVIVVILTCSPVSAYWTLSNGPQQCINEKIHLLVGGILNTSTDFIVFFLPLPTVLSLKIPRRQQVILCLVFGAGLVVCVAGCVRIWFTWQTTNSYDRTWVSYGLWISAVIELYVGIICASIPACKPFFSRYLPGVLGSTFKGKPTDYYANSRSNQKQFMDTPTPLNASLGTATTIVTAPADPYELEKLQPAQIKATTQFNTRVTSKHMLPLSYLDQNQVVENERRVRRQSSNDTSLSSFIELNDSPPPTPPLKLPISKFSISHPPGSSQGLDWIGRVESREGLVKGDENV